METEKEFTTEVADDEIIEINETEAQPEAEEQPETTKPEAEPQTEIEFNPEEKTEAAEEQTEPTEVQEPKVEKRGRKKGGKNTAKNSEETKAKSEKLKGEIFDKTKYETITPPAAPTTPTAAPLVDVSKFISGTLLLIAIDSFFPAILLKVCGFFTNSFKGVKSSQLRMSSAERKELEPIADEVVKIIFGQMHPLSAFMMCLTIIYGGKLITLSDARE